MESERFLDRGHHTPSRYHEHTDAHLAVLSLVTPVRELENGLNWFDRILGSELILLGSSSQFHENSRLARELGEHPAISDLLGFSEAAFSQ